MISVKSVTWREYAVEFLMAYLVSLITIIALFRAPSVFVHVISATIFGILYFAFKKYVVSFGHPVINIANIAVKKVSLGLGAALLAIEFAAAALAGFTSWLIIDKIAERLKGITGFAKLSFESGLAEFIGGFILVLGISSYLAHTKNSDTNAMIPFIFTIYGAMIVSALFGSLGFINPNFALAVGLYSNIVYMLVPVIGGIVGALVYNIFGEGKTFAQIYKTNV